MFLAQNFLPQILLHIAVAHSLLIYFTEIPTPHLLKFSEIISPPPPIYFNPLFIWHLRVPPPRQLLYICSLEVWEVKITCKCPTSGLYFVNQMFPATLLTSIFSLLYHYQLSCFVERILELITHCNMMKRKILPNGINGKYGYHIGEFCGT